MSAIQEQGRYCSRYSLSEVCTCGCCGSYYRRTGKTVNGKVQHVWRCIGRIEHRCADAIGVEESKLQAAVCRCLSAMMQNSDEVIALCKQNLQYAFTGDEKAIVMKYEEISVLREQVKVAKAQTVQNDDVAREIENFIKDMESYEKTPITEFNDPMVRRLIDNIRIMPDKKIIVVLKGGMQRE